MNAAVLVTHDSQNFLPATLDSILAQSTKVDRIVVVDDRSADGTMAILDKYSDLHAANGGSTFEVHRATTTASDITTRIAQNFRQGVIAAQDAEIVILGDHDDIWHVERVTRQQAQLASHPAALMVASDGRLVDKAGAPLGSTLRNEFPVIAHFNDATPAEQLHYALRHSVATGGASAVRPQYFASADIPAGWLHDRWWSLLAIVRLGLLIDTEIVIDYRITDTQQVGLAQGLQGNSGTAAKLAKAPDLLKRLRTVHKELRKASATPELYEALAYATLMRAMR